MATYVMSDIHGDYERYCKMLQQIQFKDTDTLYVLGDVIDRGPYGMKILKDMMLRANVYPILGNHEYMASLCMKWLLKEVTEESVAQISPGLMQGLTEWMNVGGEASISEFHNLSEQERAGIADYLEEFVLYEEIKVNGRTFVLVHAGLQNFTPERNLDTYDLSELIFYKPDYDKVYYKDKFLVTGHVPTRVAYAREQRKLIEELLPEERKDCIFYKNNHIVLDCGCGFDGRLGCLCLDTMEEFYV